MVMVAGAIAFTDHWSAQTVAAGIARAAARYPILQERLLYADERFALYAVERPTDKPVVTTHTAGAERLWLLGDINYMAVNAAAAGASQSSPESIPGRWVAIQHNAATGAMRLSSDRLGLASVYIASIPGGYIFASDFAAVAAQVNCPLTVDYDTVLLELAVGYTPDDKTVFNEISIAPPGTTIELRRAGIATVAQPALEYGDRYAQLSTQAKYERLDAIYDRITNDVLRRFGQETILSLSGGYDSRYILAFVDKHGLQPQLFTFGDPASEEVHKARAICAKVGRSTTLFSAIAGAWDDWRRRVALLGNSGMIQWSGWAEAWLSLLRQHGRASMIGYLGDALSGKHLVAATAEAGSSDWLRHWLRWSGGGWTTAALLREPARQRMQEVVHARMQEAAAKASCAFAHQVALHLDLYGRQRRFVAAQPSLIGRFLTPVLFFYDSELIDFWANLPYADLQRQQLYLAYAQDRFPQLFPRGEGQVQAPSLAARGLNKANRLARRLLGEQTPQPGTRVIDHRRIIIPNKKPITDLARRVAPLVDDIIAVEAFCDEVVRYDGQARSLSSYEIIRAVNLFMLLDLACDG